ncbi:MAG: PilW family protein [Solimonas sp.]
MPASPAVRASSATQRGFSVVELMIAMVLGLIVIAGASAVFLSNKQAYRSNQALGRIQENARVAFELLARDARQAGLTGCGNSTRVANVLNNGPSGSETEAWYADFADNAVHGYDDAETDPAITTGTSSAQRLSGTDSLTLIGAGSPTYGITLHTIGSAQNFTLNEGTTSLEAGDLVIVCDPDHATIAQVTGISGSAVQVLASGTPGNCVVGLGYPTSCSSSNAYQFAENSLLSKLLAVDWYIGTNAQGTLSLYRKTVVTESSAATAEAQEMIRNVVDMQIQYHVADATDFEDASDVASSDWSNVDAIRVTLTFKDSNDNSGTGTAPIYREMSASITLRNRV